MTETLVGPEPGLLPLVKKEDFIGLPGLCHLATAGEAPLLVSQRSVFAEFADDKSVGMGGRERIYAKVSRAGDSVAALLGCQPSEIGFPQNVGQGMSMVARHFSGNGGNVVMPQWEYPSAMYPWVTGTDLEVRLVSNANYLMDADRYLDSVDSETRAIVVSLVSYYTGERIDLEVYRQIADSCGAALIVDLSHALGAASFDISLTDFAFSCGYKWALGTHGAGVAYCNSNRRPDWEAYESGWTAAEWVDADVRTTTVRSVTNGRRFELGNPAALCVQMLGNGIDYLRSSGPAVIENHVLALTDVLHSELTSRGLRVLTPAQPTRRMGIVSFTVDDEQGWRQGLEDEGVLTWVGDKRVRLSPHLYSGMADIRHAIDGIDAVRERLGLAG